MKQLFFLLLLLNNLVLQSQVVNELASMPEAVTNNAVATATVNGIPYVYSFAGLDSTKLYTGIHKRGFRYNTQTDIWEQIADLPTGNGRIAAAASTVNNKIYIIGGYEVFENGNEASFDKVHIYDPATNTYLADGAPIPVPIDDQVQAVWRDSLIFVVTGWSNDDNVTNVQIYNPAQNEWSVGTDTPNSTIYKVFGASGLILGDTIYYAGGVRRSSSFNMTSFFRKGYINPDNPNEIEWEHESNQLARGYRMGVGQLNDDHIIWLGGAETPYNYDGLAYTNGQGVPPLERIVEYTPINGQLNEQFFDLKIMDLRAIAQMSPTQFIIAGGMLENQKVSNKTYQIDVAFVPTIALKEQRINIFPNPATNFIAIDYLSPISCTIYNKMGQMVLHKKQNTTKVLSIENLDVGVYFIAIKENNRLIAYQKIIKSND